VASFVAGPNHAEEVTQLAFIKAFCALGRFQVGRPFEPWLLQIVVNEGRTIRRTEGREAALLARATAAIGTSPPGDQPDARVAQSETKATLDTALALLVSQAS
jgi:DNA-directed RNA polymerase specialized sigma24 family protein